MGGDSPFNLAGKDWFTVAEAAHYCGVSEDHFRRRASEYGLVPRNFMGRQLYEKAALYAAISNSQPWHSVAELRNTGAAVAVPGWTPELARRLRGERLRPFKPRKKST